MKKALALALALLMLAALAACGDKTKDDTKPTNTTTANSNKEPIVFTYVANDYDVYRFEGEETWKFDDGVFYGASGSITMTEGMITMDDDTGEEVELSAEDALLQFIDDYSLDGELYSTFTVEGNKVSFTATKDSEYGKMFIYQKAKAETTKEDGSVKDEATPDYFYGHTEAKKALSQGKLTNGIYTKDNFTLVSG